MADASASSGSSVSASPDPAPRPSAVPANGQWENEGGSLSPTSPPPPPVSPPTAADRKTQWRNRAQLISMVGLMTATLALATYVPDWPIRLAALVISGATLIRLVLFVSHRMRDRRLHKQR